MYLLVPAEDERSRIPAPCQTGHSPSHTISYRTRSSWSRDRFPPIGSENSGRNFLYRQCVYGWHFISRGWIAFCLTVANRLISTLQLPSSSIKHIIHSSPVSSSTVRVTPRGPAIKCRQSSYEATNISKSSELNLEW